MSKERARHAQPAQRYRIADALPGRVGHGGHQVDRAETGSNTIQPPNRTVPAFVIDCRCEGGIDFSGVTGDGNEAKRGKVKARFAQFPLQPSQT